MNLKLRISADLERALKSRAAATGEDIESIVLKTLEESLADEDAERGRSQGSGGDFAAWLEAWINRHPIVSHTIDDSRESIYAGRGE